ncbi:hypothetical protein KHS38_09685 [Mucilaginibacter sp. Bleaf8]|uniref:hypothetical protein n=1 Tax=Mucilaginibacter sp. Bleaf8 TaxID=2834430 RepID=UPI001BCE1578|nr:hypothetical protein [Mucilaginibacter sp. Bleaf8]MBS7564674.1 hypothetical protein [Mucilaginibacter sp. Bleaf8]
MANFNEIKDYAEKRAFYDGLSSFFSTGNTLNKMFYSALFAVLGIFFVIWFFANADTWDSNGTWDIVKPGDKLYAYHRFFEDTSTYHTLTVYRKMRPPTFADIDKMNIAEWEKRKLKLHLDTTLKLYMEPQTIIIVPDSLIKENSAFIGTYLKKDSVTETRTDQAKWYAFKPNFKVTAPAPKYDTPPNYVIDDSLYYVRINNVELAEYEKFKKK